MVGEAPAEEGDGKGKWEGPWRRRVIQEDDGVAVRIDVVADWIWERVGRRL